MLQNQIGQIANALLNRPQGTLSSDTEANPGKKEMKEQVQAVTLRSEKVTKEKESTTEQNKEESDQQVETPDVLEIIHLNRKRTITVLIFKIRPPRLKLFSQPIIINLGGLEPNFQNFGFIS